MTNRFSTPTKRFNVELEKPFASTPFGVALNTVFGLPTAAKDVARTIQLGIARNIGSAGLTIAKPFGGVEELKKGEGEIKQKAFEVLFGDEPLKPLEDRIADAEIGIKSSPTAQKFGIDKYALPLAFGAIIADTALDLTPLIGSKTGVKALIKETTSEGVMKILTRSGIPADIAKEFAPKLAKSTSKREVVEIVKLLGGSAGAKLVDDAVTSIPKISSDEFIESHQKVFRGGEALDISKGKGRGIPVTADRKIAEAFAKGKAEFDVSPTGKILTDISGKKPRKNIIEEFYLDSSARIATRNDIPDDIYKAYRSATPVTTPEIAEPILSKWARDNGFDAIDFRTLGETSLKEAEIKILNPDILKTESQLLETFKQSGNIPTDDAVSKLIKAVKEAGQPREVLEQAFTAERAKRAGTVEGIFGGGKGQKGYYQALSKLKGKLAKKKKFELIKLDQGDVDDLFNIAQQHPHLDVFDKVTVQNSLNKLLKGELPSKRELVFLEEVYGRELIEEVLKKRGLLSKLGDAVTEAFNIPRTLITAFDMSAPLRQGVLLVPRQPKAFSKAIWQSFMQVFSPTNFKHWLDDLPNHPNYNQMRAAKLYIADPDSLARGLSGREEAFMSRIAERFPKSDIPILKYPVNFFGTIYNVTAGAGVRASERAFVSFLNKLRVDVFTKLVTNFSKEKKLSVDELKSLGNFVNTATGRGNLGAFERSAQALNTIFFSPRLIAARFNMLNPVWYARQSPKVRLEAIKTMATFIGTGATILALINAAGRDKNDVEIDPRSTDFGKIRVGNMRWDIWGGFQQWVRMFAQVASRKKKKTGSGEIIELTGKGFTDSPLNIIGRFARYKLAPVPSLIFELIDGQTIFGEDVKLKTEVAENTIPLYFQDLIDAMNEEGTEAIFTVGLPAFFGVGVNTYKSKSKSLGGKGNRFSF
jgi:hypothetical protein